MPKSKVVNEEEAIRWMEAGWTNKQIQEEYRRKYNIETGESMWSNRRHRWGFIALVARNDDLIPWAVRKEHKGSYLLQMLRHEGRVRAGKSISEYSKARLESFHQNLRITDAVVFYEPDSAKGFYYVPRRHDIDKDIIREPDRRTKPNRIRPR